MRSICASSCPRWSAGASATCAATRGQRLILRHDSFERTPWTRAEPLLPLATALEAFAGHGRGREARPQRRAGRPRRSTGPGPTGTGSTTTTCGSTPPSRQSAPRDSTGCGQPTRAPSCSARSTSWRPLVVAAPSQARTVLRLLAGWGISRFSVAWGRQRTRSLVRHRLEEWGYEVNLYAVPDHESFLQAVLLLPRSLTADFNFPGWNYYGRGSGEAAPLPPLSEARVDTVCQKAPTRGGRPRYSDGARRAERGLRVVVERPMAPASLRGHVPVSYDRAVWGGRIFGFADSGWRGPSSVDELAWSSSVTGWR